MSARRNSSRSNNPNSELQWSSDQSPLIRTAGEVFADGSSIDLVRNAATNEICLAGFDGKSCKFGDRIETRGRVYLPAQIEPTILDAVILPESCGDYGTTSKLFAAIREQFASNGFPEDVALAATHFVFSSWFPDALAVAPCLLISGPHSEAMCFLRLLGCFVRHALRLAEVTRAGLCLLPMDLPLTYLIEQEPVSRSTRSLLYGSNNPGSYAPWHAGVTKIYCGKAVYMGSGLAASRVGDSALQVHLTPFREKLPVLDAIAERSIAEEFQSKMLAYRFRNVHRVRDSRFELTGLTSGTRILSRILGACIVDEPKLQAGLETLLLNQDDLARASRWTDLRCVAIEAALYYSHREEADRTYVAKLTATGSAILKFRGKTTQLSPEEFGRVLRIVGLMPERDSRGSALVFNDQLRRRIHELARDYDVAAVQQGIAACPLCSEILSASAPRKTKPES